MIGVFHHRVDLALENTADLVVRHARDGLVVVDQVLNLCFDGVGQLVAVACKNLDAVVFVGVVACGNDDACVSLVLDGQVCDRGRRDNAEQLNVRADRADACDQRVLQHIRRDTGILADQQLCLFAVCGFLRQRISRCRADFEREQCVQFEVCNATDTVRSKVSTQ